MALDQSRPANESGRTIVVGSKGTCGGDRGDGDDKKQAMFNSLLLCFLLHNRIRQGLWPYETESVCMLRELSNMLGHSKTGPTTTRCAMGVLREQEACL